MISYLRFQNTKSLKIKYFVVSLTEGFSKFSVNSFGGKNLLEQIWGHLWSLIILSVNMYAFHCRNGWFDYRVSQASVRVSDSMWCMSNINFLMPKNSRFWNTFDSDCFRKRLWACSKLMIKIFLAELKLIRRVVSFEVKAMNLVLNNYTC